MQRGSGIYLVPGQLKDIDNDKRNVILLAHGRRSPPLEFGEHLT
jgi:hypothetical protein